LCLEDFAILCLKSVEYTIFVKKKKNSKNTLMMQWLWNESLNSDDQQFHQY
jgi:hypothetical protein